MITNPAQRPLWLEHVYKALDDSICAIGPENRNAYEHMADLLWATKSERTRYSRIKACLDPLQEHTNFDPEEFLFILECEGKAGVEISVHYLMDRLNRNLGEKKAPRSPKSVLMDKQAELANEAASLQRKIDRIDAAENLKAVR